jgi:multiple sugar transport system permease protein
MGGPQGSTNLVMNEIFSRAFDGDIGGAAAATTILVLVVLVVVSLQFRLMRGKDNAT